MGTLLKIDDVAHRLKLTRGTVYQYIRQGLLPALRIGRVYRIDEMELDAFIAASRTGREVETSTEED